MKYICFVSEYALQINWEDFYCGKLSLKKKKLYEQCSGEFTMQFHCNSVLSKQSIWGDVVQLCISQWEANYPTKFYIQILSQMKHQLDATLCRFYFCIVTLHVSGASAHHQEYFKLVERPLVHVLSLQVSHNISLLGPPALIRRCDDWPATITHVPVAALLVLNTPDDGRLRPKHVEWPCRNKTCTVLHQVGVFIWPPKYQNYIRKCSIG